MNSENQSQEPQDQPPVNLPKEIDPKTKQLLQQNLQLHRIVWALVEALGGTAIIDEKTINPFWELNIGKTEDQKLKIRTSVKPLPDANKLRQLTEFLLGSCCEVQFALDKFKIEFEPELITEILRKEGLAVQQGTLWVKPEPIEATNQQG